MLVDSVEITVKAGKGGDGAVSWRREKHVPKGGPDGGDGGRGGNVILITDNNVDTLTNFRYRKVFQAEEGERGKSKKMTGRGGRDLELAVPPGTIVSDSENGKILRDLVSPGERFVVARGGDGGLGNPHFATATHQQPTEATPGKPGQNRRITLELQLIADVALIGQPNAGKSSIINCLTDAKSRIGAFAFSTREPVLGVMNDGERSITLVDLPGLLEGAHKGRGLGDEFLKHAQRVKAIAHVVDASQGEPSAAITQIASELSEFDPALSERASLLVLNKTDLLKPEELASLKKKYPKAIFTSAETKAGIEQLRQRIAGLVA